MRRLLFALSILSGMSACQSINQMVAGSVSAGSPVNQNAQEVALYQSLITPPIILNCLQQARGTGARQSCRDLITYARLKYADLNYDQFRKDLFATVNGGNTAADITILGLGSAGALVGGATTKAILAAISAGIAGAKGIIDRDLLYNVGIQTLILKMDADRATIRVKITENLKFDETTYPFEQAELDSADYYRAGTLTSALVTLQGDAAAQAATARAAMNGTVQTGTPVIVVPAPVVPQPASVLPAPSPPTTPSILPNPLGPLPASAPPPPVVSPSPAAPVPFIPPAPPIKEPLPAEVNSRLQTLTDFLSKPANAGKLPQVALKLNLPATSTAGTINRTIFNQLANSKDPTKELKDLSDSLRFITGRNF